MKKLNPTVLLAAIFLGTVAVAPAQVFPVTTQLTLKQQNPTRLSGSTYTDTVGSVRINSGTLLYLLSAGYTDRFPNGFPAGSRLVLVNFDHFEVESFSGNILVSNTAPYLTYSDTFSQTNVLFQGKENVATGAISHTYFYQSTITFQDPIPNGISFTFTGNTQEKYKRSAEDVFGDSLAQGSLSITGIGSGTNGDGFVLLTGKFTMPTSRWIE